ncbi:MAG: anthranilate phosphoribosyltransferase [Trebouxia sp. A1-2]|nr:MAG: anthranilate phosphoribosyltransferase [Trebouxia sp. A1-2]
MMMQAGCNCKLGISQPSTRLPSQLRLRIRSAQKRIECSSYTLDQPETKHAKPEAIHLPQVLSALMQRRDLTKEQCRAAVSSIVDGEINVAQAAAFMVLLHSKGETPQEMAGLAEAMQLKAVPVHTSCDVLDIVGTGGDGIGSVNISTGACVLAAAAGAHVAKHGSRAVSSSCGAADVLEALGVAVELSPTSVSRCIEETRLGFMYAPYYHPVMKSVKSVRSALQVRTTLNMLGPLLNPAGAVYGLIGVYSPDISMLMAQALQQLGTRKALVVHSQGMDELTPMGTADVVEATQDNIRRYVLEPKDLGIRRCQVSDLKGGDAALNAQILRDVFGGQQGAVADALCLNAGVALAAAQEVQRSGQAGNTLQSWIDVSQQLHFADTQDAAHSA